MHSSVKSSQSSREGSKRNGGSSVLIKGLLGPGMISGAGAAKSSPRVSVILLQLYEDQPFSGSLQKAHMHPEIQPTLYKSSS